MPVPHELDPQRSGAPIDLSSESPTERSNIRDYVGYLIDQIEPTARSRAWRSATCRPNNPLGRRS